MITTKHSVIFRMTLLGVLTILLVSIGIAQEASSEDEQAENEKAAVETPTERRSPNITFQPTEEISEDLPVSFPGDI